MTPMLRALALACTLTVFSCALHEVNETIEPPSLTPDTFSDSGDVEPLDQWWRNFGDAGLDQAMEGALAGSVEMQIAWSRLRQFEAVAKRINTMPTVDINGSARRGRTFINFGGQRVTFTNNNFNLDATVGYEADIWRRLSSLDKAEALQARATREEVEATALTLSGNLARTWYSLSAQREQLALLQSQVETNEKFVTVLETRFANALASAVEVFQARRQLAAIQSRIPNTEARIKTLSNAIAALSGLAPGSAAYSEASRLPELPPLPDTGLPAELLRNRPDIRAAAARITAADFQLAAAIAARYPSLRLTGSTGFTDSDLSELLDNWIWSIAGSLLAPIIDGGARRAEAERSRAVVEERLATYEQTMLRALREVEDALAQERGQRAFIDQLQAQLDVARKGYEAGQRRYLQGVGDFLTVLTEFQALQQIEQSLVIARQDLITNRVNLYQALGGDWTTGLEDPAQNARGGNP